jgi:hypothetical protein
MTPIEDNTVREVRFRHHGIFCVIIWKTHAASFPALERFGPSKLARLSSAPLFLYKLSAIPA